MRYYSERITLREIIALYFDRALTMYNLEVEENYALTKHISDASFSTKKRGRREAFDTVACAWADPHAIDDPHRHQVVRYCRTTLAYRVIRLGQAESQP